MKYEISVVHGIYIYNIFTLHSYLGNDSVNLTSNVELSKYSEYILRVHDNEYINMSDVITTLSSYYELHNTLFHYSEHDNSRENTEKAVLNILTLIADTLNAITGDDVRVEITGGGKEYATVYDTKHKGYSQLGDKEEDNGDKNKL